MRVAKAVYKNKDMERALRMVLEMVDEVCFIHAYLSKSNEKTKKIALCP